MAYMAKLGQKQHNKWEKMPNCDKNQAPKWQVYMVGLMMTDNDFRDGAGCFGNNDGVPPSEVSQIQVHP